MQADKILTLRGTVHVLQIQSDTSVVADPRIEIGLCVVRMAGRQGWLTL